MPKRPEQHKRGRDGVLEDGASYYPASASDLELYDQDERTSNVSRHPFFLIELRRTIDFILPLSTARAMTRTLIQATQRILA